MADARNLTCPSCGAPLPIEHRFVRMVTCRYCETVSEVTDEGLNPSGKMARLVPLPTRFQVGQTGKFRGRRFRVLGRVRYSHEEGVWDEWYLAFEDGDTAWVEEEEGEVIFARMERLRNPVPPFEQARLGTQFETNGRPFFVTERCRARIAGSEGQLFYRAVPGSAVNFVEGNVGGKIAFLEYTDDAIEFGVGEPVERHEIELEGVA
jgi:hypothetical protein